MIDLKSLNKNLLDLKQQYDSQMNQRNTLASEVDKYKNSLKDLNSKKRKLSNDRANHIKSITKLQQLRTNPTKNNVVSIDKSISNEEQQISAIDDEIVSINQQIDNVREQKSEAEKSLFMVDQKLTGNVGSITQKFSSLIDALQASIKEEEISLEQNSKRLKFFNPQKIAEAEKELEDLKEQKYDIEHQTPSVKDLENQREMLLRDNPMIDEFYLEGIDAQIAELKQKQFKIDTSISDKENEISNLRLFEPDNEYKNPKDIKIEHNQLATLKKAINTIQIPEKSSPEALNESFNTISNAMNAFLPIEQSDKKTENLEISTNSANKSKNKNKNVNSNKKPIDAAMRTDREAQHQKIQTELAKAIPYFNMKTNYLSRSFAAKLGGYNLSDAPASSSKDTHKSITSETPDNVNSNKGRIKAALRFAREAQHQKIQTEKFTEAINDSNIKIKALNDFFVEKFDGYNLSDAPASSSKDTHESITSETPDTHASNSNDAPKSNVSKSPDTSASGSKDAPKSNVSKSPDTSASDSKDAPKSNTSELPDVPKKGFLKKAIYAALTVLIIGAGILGFKSFKNKAENNKQTKQEQENEMGNSNNDDSSINVDEVDSITVNEEGQIINTENKLPDSSNAEYETYSDISIDETQSTSSENTSKSESTPTTYQNNEYYYDQFTQQTNIALEEAQNYLEQSNKEKDSDKKKEDIYNAAQSLKVALENEKSVNYHSDGNKGSDSSSISTSQVYSEVVDKLTETFNNYQADLEDIDKQIQENQDKLDELNQHNSNSVEEINSIQTYTADISNLKKQKDAIESDLESVSKLLKDLPLQEQEPVTNNDSSQSTTTSQNKSKDFRDSQVVIQPLFDIGSPCVISSDITLYGDSEETPSKGHYAFENPTQVQICAFAAVSKKTGFYDHNSRSMTLYNIQKAYPSDDYIIMALLGRPGFDYEDRKGWYGWTSYQKLADSQNKNMWNDISKDNISAQYIDDSISFR